MDWEYRISYGTHHLIGDQDAVEALAAVLTAAGTEHYMHRRSIGLGSMHDRGPWQLWTA
ncbi:hypothetical protein MYK68_18575 [Gordonia sp. PP30]|uniref:hypothetical protein n=1 Tax=Gordonia sp. PP30 TaxID=2935861 RepID=UPI001FFF7747|nr:hypothetical protein [Gordonia sp. PP30]UQE74690.1 hypothetical protein MYK68_18575 [Gordonia sp. PP30]